jgi:hypothetical protein
MFPTCPKPCRITHTQTIVGPNYESHVKGIFVSLGLLKEPVESWPPLMDWKDTALSILAMGYDQKSDPPKVYPFDLKMVTNTMTEGGVGIERGFSRLSAVAFILKIVFLDMSINELAEDELASLQMCPQTKQHTKHIHKHQACAANVFGSLPVYASSYPTHGTPWQFDHDFRVNPPGQLDGGL